MRTAGNRVSCDGLEHADRLSVVADREASGRARRETGLRVNLMSVRALLCSSGRGILLARRKTWKVG
jgi:hypothetical protein